MENSHHRQPSYFHNSARHQGASGYSRSANFHLEDSWPARPSAAATPPSQTAWAHVIQEPAPPVEQWQRPAAAAHSSDSAAMMLLHCLFAMVFAAAVMGLLHCLGFVVRSSTSCPLREGDSAGVYSACEIWQDTRSVLSFVLGAVLCCFMTRNADGQVCPPGTPEQAAIAQEAAGAEKLQLYACLL